ncbi:hypothetical protein NL676_011511 [Syzygium grande]|nr:hypothetical protein NL676_011511 [Syzygium grande]
MLLPPTFQKEAIFVTSNTAKKQGETAETTKAPAMGLKKKRGNKLDGSESSRGAPRNRKCLNATCSTALETEKVPFLRATATRGDKMRRVPTATEKATEKGQKATHKLEERD